MGHGVGLNGQRGIRHELTIAVHCAIYVVARSFRDDRTLLHWACVE